MFICAWVLRSPWMVCSANLIPIFSEQSMPSMLYILAHKQKSCLRHPWMKSNIMFLVTIELEVALPISICNLCILVVIHFWKAELVTDFQVEQTSTRKHSWTELFQGNRGTENERSSDQARGPGSVAPQQPIQQPAMEPVSTEPLVSPNDHTLKRLSSWLSFQSVSSRSPHKTFCKRLHCIPFLSSFVEKHL